LNLVFNTKYLYHMSDNSSVVSRSDQHLRDVASIDRVSVRNNIAVLGRLRNSDSLEIHAIRCSVHMTCA